MNLSCPSSVSVCSFNHAIQVMKIAFSNVDASIDWRILAWGLHVTELLGAKQRCNALVMRSCSRQHRPCSEEKLLVACWLQLLRRSQMIGARTSVSLHSDSPPEQTAHARATDAQERGLDQILDTETRSRDPSGDKGRFRRSFAQCSDRYRATRFTRW